MLDSLHLHPDDLLFDGADRQCRGGELAAAVVALAAELPEGACVAFAFEHDSMAFAVALLACWRRGCVPLLPPNARRPGVAAALQRATQGAFLHDTGAGTGIHVPRCLGTTPAMREPLAVPFGAVQLGELTADGNLTVREVPADLVARATEGAVADLHLVAGQSVANLFRPAFGPALALGTLGPLAARCRQVWFAGGQSGAVPASPDRRAAVWLAPTPWWRRVARALGSSPPQRVATCDVPLDGPSRNWLAAQGCDLAHGSALEPPQTLPGSVVAALDACWQMGAVDAAVVERTLPGQAAPCTFVLAAGAELDDAALAAALRTQGSSVSAVAPSLPRDSDGRLADADLLRCLGRLPDGQLPLRELEWQWQVDGAQVVGTTTVPAHYHAFAGHFIGYPLLNGAVQLHDLVLPALRRAHGAAAHLIELQDLKFQARIGPGAALTITVTTVAAEQIEYTIVCAGTRCSTGRARFAAGAP
jgi:3-hydroxymyristoyl/3-hydroxydecanoyl-(acyl carrier protein) dehydratase